MGVFQEDGGRSGLGIGKAGSGAPKAMSEMLISQQQTESQVLVAATQTIR